MLLLFTWGSLTIVLTHKVRVKEGAKACRKNRSLFSIADANLGSNLQTAVELLGSSPIACYPQKG